VDERDLSVDPREIAKRLRALLGHFDDAQLPTLARNLRVDERELGATLDGTRVSLSIPVLSAAVRAYGVDPTWLLTGEYDLETHHAALDDERLISLAALTQSIARRLSPDPHRGPRITEIPDDL
jgi:hypothetical protein